MNDQECRQVNSSIAWFKLADLVIRKEREKALNVYRLLAHSLEDRAYALQLEGDLLWYFEDNLCLKKYEEAAILYEAQKRWIETAALYEQLYYLAPAIEHIFVLLRAYVVIKHAKQSAHCFALIREALNEKIIDESKIVEIVKGIVDLHDADARKELREWLMSHEQASGFFLSLTPETCEQIKLLL